MTSCRSKGGCVSLIFAPSAVSVAIASSRAASTAESAGHENRSTGSAVFAVHRGTGTAQIGDKTFAIAPHDVFVAPPWLPYSFTADSEVELFSYSDRAGQEALGYWREQIG